jgi:hypothetical protein
MRSSCSRSRNHLLYFTGKGAQARVCNQIIMLQSVFSAIPDILRSYGFNSIMLHL